MVAPKETKLWVLSKLPTHDDGQFRAMFSKMILTQQTKTGKLKGMSQNHGEEEQRASPTPFIRMESPSFSLWHLWTQGEKEKLRIMEKDRKILCSVSGGMGCGWKGIAVVFYMQYSPKGGPEGGWLSREWWENMVHTELWAVRHILDFILK